MALWVTACNAILNQGRAEDRGSWLKFSNVYACAQRKEKDQNGLRFLIFKQFLKRFYKWTA